MSVTDLLKKVGKPTEISELHKIVAKELNLNQRCCRRAPELASVIAYRLILKAWKNKDIIKVTLPDRTVLCLLPGWSLPDSTSKQHKETHMASP